MNRRGFLGSILVALTAPAIIRADSLMRVVPTKTLILPASLTGGGFVRETVAYDIINDMVLVRLDVLVRENGILDQYGVDSQYYFSEFKKDDPKRNDAALEVLENSIRNLTPVRGLSLEGFSGESVKSRFI